MFGNTTLSQVFSHAMTEQRLVLLREKEAYAWSESRLAVCSQCMLYCSGQDVLKHVGSFRD